MPRKIIDTSPHAIEYRDDPGPYVNGLSSLVQSLWRGRMQREQLENDRADKLWTRGRVEAQDARQIAMDQQGRDDRMLAQERQGRQDEIAVGEREFQHAHIKHQEDIQNQQEGIRALNEGTRADQQRAGEEHMQQQDAQNALDSYYKGTANKANDPIVRSQTVWGNAIKHARDLLGGTATPDEVTREARATYDRLQSEPDSGVLPRQLNPDEEVTPAAPAAPAPEQPGVASRLWSGAKGGIARLWGGGESQAQPPGVENVPADSLESVAGFSGEGADPAVENAAAQPAPAAGKTVDQETLAQYAQKHGMDIGSAADFLTRQGYVVQ